MKCIFGRDNAKISHFLKPFLVQDGAKKPQFWNFWGPFFRKNIISRGKNSWKTRFRRQKNFLTHKSPLKWQKTGFLTPICFRKRWPSKVSKFRFFCTTLYILPYICKFFHIFSYFCNICLLFENSSLGFTEVFQG